MNSTRSARRVRATIVVVAILAFANVSSARTQSGFNYDRYKTARLADLIREETEVGEGKGDIVLTGDMRPSRVRVTFTGKNRALADSGRKVWQNHMASRRMDPGLGDLFENEWAFNEGGKEYWLPVQKQLEHSFADELKPGDEIDLFIAYIGGLNVNRRFTPVFIVNEFEKAVGPTAPAN